MTKPITKSRIKVEPDSKKSGFDLMKDGIKNNPLYKKPYNTKKVEASNIIRENCEDIGGSKIIPGQLIYFNYFEPKTKEDLEYYDATPLTIYFTRYNSKQGLRIIGINFHYFPPKIRYKVMAFIMKLFWPMFKKYWDKGPSSEISGFDYEFLIDELTKYNLQFCVRQYDPKLMSDVKIVPPKWFSTAAFTEGTFKKETRAQILSYWKNWSPNPSKKTNKV